MQAMKLGRALSAPVPSSQVQLYVADLCDYEREGGACPTCGRRARLLTCWECCETAWVIDCSHRTDRPPVRAGRADDSDRHRLFCVDCAEVLRDDDESLK